MIYTATESADSSWLGVYNVKNGINKLGAKIDFDSTDRVDTTFVVTIPNAINNKKTEKKAKVTKV